MGLPSIGTKLGSSSRGNRIPSLYHGFSSAKSSSFVASTALLKHDVHVQVGGSSSSATNLMRSSTLIMGKGDGKKKRKKKTKSSASAVGGAHSPPNPPSPLRVTNDINIPVRQQIKWAQMKKEAERHSGQAFRQKRRTKYRRTWTEEEIEVKREERKRKGQDPDWNVILNRTAAAPLVIVDGYNIIFKWARLKKHMRKGDLQRARDLLVDDLEVLRSIKGWRIEVVFDSGGKSMVGPLGHGPGNRGLGTAKSRTADEKDVTDRGVRLVFTKSADTYIETRCFEAKNVTDGKLTGSFIVATDDNLIRNTAQNAGAMCMGANRFVDELKALKKIVSDTIETTLNRLNKAEIRSDNALQEREHELGGRVIITTTGKSVWVVDNRNETEIEMKQESENRIMGRGWKTQRTQEGAVNEIIRMMPKKNFTHGKPSR